MSGKVRECQGKSGNVRESQGMLGKVRECQGKSGNVRESQGMSGKVRECQGKSENVRESQGNLQWSGENSSFVMQVKEKMPFLSSQKYLIYLVYIRNLSFSNFYL